MYLFEDEEGKILYVGKARDLKKRVGTYFSNKKLDTKTLKLVGKIKKVDFILTNSEIEAFLLEATLIKKHRPFYNIQLRDDKTYPYIKIAKSKEGVPYIHLTRNTADKKGEYFGPYTEVQSVKAVLKILRRIFPFYTSEYNTKKRSLYDHIGLAPDISQNPEKVKEYKANIRKLKQFLKGRTESVTKDLKKEQKIYIELEEFEKAQEIQEQIEKIELITSKFYDPFQYVETPNLYNEKIKRELHSLKNTLTKYGMNVGMLERIECYDISNLQGKQATGSMVVLKNGDVAKSEYKRFKVRTKSSPDDYHMMKEVLKRRLNHDDWKTPDLIVIDGGKGQVAAALEVGVSQNKNIATIGLAKKEETIIIPQRIGGKMEFVEEKLGKENPGVNLLRRVRDEAHRFARTYHILLRKKQLTQ